MSRRSDSESNVTTRRIIVEEVSKMRGDITREILGELREMRELITKDIMETLQTYLDQEISRVMRNNRTGGDKTSERIQNITQDIKQEVMDEMDKKIENMNNQIVLSNNKQLSVTKQLTKDMAKAITMAASKQAYQAVVIDINKTIVPKINDMMQWVNYNMQDTGELITDYRRAVEEQSRESDIKMLASSKGEDKKRWAGGNVGLFFDEDSVGI